MSDGEGLHILDIPADAEGERLDAYVATQIESTSRSYLAQLIKQGRVLVDAHPARASTRLKAGNRVEVRIPPPSPTAIEPQDLGLTFFYEDEHLAFVLKPSGMPTHPDHHHRDGTLVNGLLYALGGSLSGIGGVERPGIVHRLDKGTSGVLVTAKSDRAHRLLCELFAAHDIERRYLALIRGHTGPQVLSIEAPIERHPKDRKRMTSRTGQGRAARTDLREIEQFPAFSELSLVECRLHTGRTHQIRTHLADLGHHILGDPIYAPRRGLAWVRSNRLRVLLSPLERPMLHAAVLGLRHPITGQELRFEAPLPQDFRELLESLRAGAGRPPETAPEPPASPPRAAE